MQESGDAKREPTCDAGSAVVEALQGAGGVDEVATGEHIGLAGNVLAVVTTTVIIT